MTSTTNEIETTVISTINGSTLQSMEIPEESKDIGDTNALLRCMINELRSMNGSLALHRDRIEALAQNKSSQHAWDSNSISLNLDSLPSEVIRSSKSSATICADSRINIILKEGLARYKLNAVPSWSCLYGTHLMRGEGPETLEDSKRIVEWTSVVGDCWKIPYDNRINLCFRAPMDDMNTAVRVRNFLSHFHRPQTGSNQRGENFNVWDWFDTGISAYWYPGKRSPAFLEDSSSFSSHNLQQNDDVYSLTTMVAPWRRIINMQGLTSLSMCVGSTSGEELTDQELCPFLAATKDSVFQEPMDEVLWRTVRSHLRCLRVTETDHTSMEPKGWILFHVTFYEILKTDENNKLAELWPSGDLHSDFQQENGRQRTIRESALTIISVPSIEIPGSSLRSIFWTMLCMWPQHFPHLYSENRDDIFRGRTHEMLDDMSDMIHTSCSTVIKRWEEIAGYFDCLLTEKQGLLNPQYHDSLLTDDAAFTRSKKYFWAIEFLKEAESSVQDNIRQIRQFVNLYTANPPVESEDMVRQGFTMRAKKFSFVLQKLEALRKGFRSKQDEAKALRDGLFSASAVMESRSATQLGQNIKVLTYVSIFFLPISVCTSFWSMSNTEFSLSALAVVIPLVSLTTYTLVLNLESVTQFFLPKDISRPGSPPRALASFSLVQYFNDSQIRAMQQSPGRIWRKRGDEFENCKIFGGDQRRPSQWRVVQFALLRLAHSLLNMFEWILRTIPDPVRRLRERKSKIHDNPFAGRNQGNLGDVHVKVHVDVDVEDA